MKKKVIWYCTGCKEKCAVKITDGYNLASWNEDECILFSDELCEEQGYRPDWRKHEPKEK